MNKKIISIILLLTFAYAGAYAKVSKHNADTTLFDRGIFLENSCFIPKGTFGTGISFNYNTYTFGNGNNDIGYQMAFNMIQDFKGNMLTMGVTPFLSYFVTNNCSVGIKFDYKKSSLGMDSFSLSLGDALSLSSGDFNYVKQSYTGSFGTRYYIPMTPGNKRFAFFAELMLTGGYAQSISYRMEEGSQPGEKLKHGTYQDIYLASIGIVPGLTMFVSNSVALEVSVGLIGLDYQYVKQNTNQVEISTMQKSAATYKINLFSIGFGISFYLNKDQFKSNKKTMQRRKEELALRENKECK